MADIVIQDEAGTTAIVTPATPTSFTVDGALRGVQGIQGVQGIPGIQGIQGVPGSKWWEGSGAPVTLETNGDFYLDVATGNVYTQTAGSWGSPIGNIRGPAGTGGDMLLATPQIVTAPKTFALNTLLDQGTIVYDCNAYGAVGDGVTDDTTAIQAAINAAHLVGGGVVHLAMGTHIISAALTMYPNVFVVGNGINVSVIKQTVANTDAFTCNDVYYGGFENIEIKSAVGHTSGSGINMLWTSNGNVEQMNLTNLLIIGFHIGVNSETLITSTIDNVECVSCDIGFNFWNGGTSITINNTYANGCLMGYYLDGLVYVSFNGTACDSSNQAYYLHNCAGITWNGSGCEAGVVETAPSAPTLGHAGTGGTVLAGVYQVIITYVSAGGESVGSSSASVTTTGSTSTITVNSPTSNGRATGWYAYVTQAGGSTYKRQQTAGSPTPIGTNLTLTAPPTTSGVVAPTLASGATAVGRGWTIDSCVGVTLNAVWNYANPSFAFYAVNSGSIMLNNFTENGPVGGAINGIYIDTSCARVTVVSPNTTSTNNLQLGGNITTLLSDVGGAATIPTIKTTAISPLTINGANGNMILNANTDGGQFNLNVDTTGVLAIFGSSTATLNVALLDGYLELDTLTASTVPYMDSNKRFTSSAITPTQLGYLSPATGNTGTGNLVFGTSPTIVTPTITTSLTVNGAAATNRSFFGKSAGSSRIEFGVSNSAESGSNAGSDFFINTYSDTGVYIATPFVLTRATGLANFNNGIAVSGGGTITGGLTISGSHLTVEGVTTTGATGTGKLVFDTSPTISAPTISGHPTIEGVTSTGATGSGKFVFDTAPTINTSGAVQGNYPTWSIKNNQSSQFAGPSIFMYNTQSTMTTQAGVMMYAGINDVGITHGYLAFFTTDYTGAQQTQFAFWDFNALTFTSAWAMTITSGNLTVSSGNINVTSGNLTLSNGTATITGSTGGLIISASPDGGDFNIFHGSGNKTLAFYGSSANTLNLNLLDGSLSFAGNVTIANNGTLTNVTLDTAGTGVVFKINGTQINAITGTGATTVQATSPTITNLTLAAGSTSLAPLVFTSGTNLTTAIAGAVEFDGVQYYATIDSTSKRGAVPVEQYFHLTANGSAITTIANFFGTTSNISLVASAYYIIDIYLWFVTTGTGTVTITLTNSAAPTSQNIIVDESPATGVNSSTPATGLLNAQILNDTTAAKTIVTPSLSAATHYMKIRVFLKNGTGTSLKIQATAGGTNLTPQIGSWWNARRVSPNNIGTFAA